MNPPRETPRALPAGDDPHAAGPRRPSPPADKPEFELTDELILCCLDQITWRPLVRPRIIGLGLAACVLGQLVAFGKVQLAERKIHLSYTAQPPTTVLMLEVWETVKGEHTPQPVKTWLQYLAEHGAGTGDLFERVSRRMASRGLITVEKQGVLGRRIAYVPLNPTAAAWPFVRIRQRLNRRDHDLPSGRDAFMLGLLSRMGFGDRFVDSASGRSRLDAAVGELDPPVLEILDNLDVLVAKAAMTQRP